MNGSVMRQAKKSDAYDVIGVRQDATTLEIKRAFRERAKETHPDLNAGRQAQDEFVRLVAAYRATEAGAIRNVPATASPVARSVRSIPTLVVAKATLLAMGALGLAFYIQSELAWKAPATPVGKSREPVQGPQDVEPVWEVGAVDGSVLAGGFGHKTAPGLALVRAVPELPNLLRVGSADVPLEVARTSTSSKTHFAHRTNSAVSSVAASVAPPRRPRDPSQAKKPRVAKAKKKDVKPVAPVRIAARRVSPVAKPTASPLELLLGLQ